MADFVEMLYRLVPGGSTNSVLPVPGFELVIDRGVGADIFDVNGNRYLDVVMGGGPLILGHAHPAIQEAVRRAAANGTQHYAIHHRALELAQRICDHVPSAEMVRYCASGTEATFHALRLARVATGRHKILKFDGAYHGHHDFGVWNLEHSDSQPGELVAESAGVQAGVAGDMLVAPFNDVAYVHELMQRHGDSIAAVICEPLQRAIPVDPQFLHALRELTSRRGAVLIFDEVVTGFRFAPGGAQELYGVTPDLTTLGKALGGGAPIAALVGRTDLMEHLVPRHNGPPFSYHCGTFNGSLLGVECAHATLDILVDDNGLDQLDQLTNQLTAELRPALEAAPFPTQLVAVHGIFQVYFTDVPPRSAADVRRQDDTAANRWSRRLLELGVFKIPAKGYLSLAHHGSTMDRLVSALATALADIR